VEPIERWLSARRAQGDVQAPPVELPPERVTGIEGARLRDHAVLVGYGRVGAPVAEELALHGVPYVIVELSRERSEALRARGLPLINGDATRPEVLAAAHVERARLIVVATPDPYQGRAVLALATRLNPAVEVVVRTHSDEERTFLEAHGAARALYGERELAVSLARHALRRFGVAHDMEAVAARTLRGGDPRGGDRSRPGAGAEAIPG
jgi:monovalent cation:H+ antiporter-2, CPA2 family